MAVIRNKGNYISNDRFGLNRHDAIYIAKHTATAVNWE